jgi:hypothetical protein
MLSSVLKTMVAWLSLCLIIILFAHVSDTSLGLNLPNKFQYSKDTYLSALQLLQSSSQAMTTIDISCMAALGFLIVKNISTSIFNSITLGFTGFISGGLAILYSSKLSYWSTWSITTGTTDIKVLLNFYQSQVFWTLVIGASLGAYAFRCCLK